MAFAASRASLAVAGAAGRAVVGGGGGARATRRAPRAVLEITDAAAVRLKELLSRKEDAEAIRIGTRMRGCNGHSYIMDYADVPEKLDEVVEDKGVKVFIDNGALFTILGTTVDWKDDDMSAEFVFVNPNAKGICGCGESFNV